MLGHHQHRPNRTTNKPFPISNTSQKRFYYRIRYRLIDVCRRCGYARAWISKSHLNICNFWYILYSRIDLLNWFIYFRSCTTQSCQCSEISVQNWYDAKGRLKSDFRWVQSNFSHYPLDFIHAPGRDLRVYRDLFMNVHLLWSQIQRSSHHIRV